MSGGRKLYQWTKDIDELLPAFYKQWCREYNAREPIPVHWKRKPEYTRDHYVNGKKRKVFQNFPIPVLYPTESQQGLWGGEGLIYGLRKKRRTSLRAPRLWKPCLLKRALYSEILDQWFAITVTERTMMLIDEAYGFDNYILKTHEVDLKSQLGMSLKRKMLQALATRSFYKNDLEKQEKIYNKYKDFLIPNEQIEWVGLTVKEAIVKARQLEEKKNPQVPLKEIYTKELIDKLKSTTLEEPKSPSKGSFLSKLNPFKTDDPLK